VLDVELDNLYACHKNDNCEFLVMQYDSRLLGRLQQLLLYFAG